MVIPSILTQHADEAAFLWFLRDRAVRAPHYTLKTLTDLDNRLEAHIDALRIAVDDCGWDPCQQVLDLDDPGGLFALAVLAFEQADEARIEASLGAACSSPKLARGVISALGWLPTEQAWQHVEPLLRSDDPLQVRIAIATCAIHRRNPGPPLNDALTSPEPLLKARAFRAVGELGLSDLLPHLRCDRTDADPGCRFWACWSAALLGEPRMLAAFADEEPTYAHLAAAIIARSTPLLSAHEWHKRIAGNPKLRRASLIASGALGDPALIPWILEQAEKPGTARLAGEALSLITGVDLHREHLDRKANESENGANEDPQDENVEMGPDASLPTPHPELVDRWWAKNHQRFACGVRHLLGMPISTDWCMRVLKDGFQRQRAAAALELAIQQPGTPLFEVRVPGPRQIQLLLRRNGGQTAYS